LPALISNVISILILHFVLSNKSKVCSSIL